MAIKGAGVYDTDEQREGELKDCLEYFQRLWHERASQPPKLDFISMMAHSDVTRDMPSNEFLGNIILLIVGGNDTTRNSISAGLYALNKYPEQYEKLLENTSLVTNMVSEIIRWQTPLSHMARTATEDYQIGGKTIRKGDRVAMWYVSGNRDLGGHRESRRIHCRPTECPQTSLIWIWRSPLHGQPDGGAPT